MSDGVSFQSGTLATPAVGTVIATDNISAVHHQLVKMEFGKDGTAYLLDYGTPMPIGTLPGGTVQIHGTAQTLGTYQPLAGSVHLASGTVSVLGTAQLTGTAHIGSIQFIAGTQQNLGTFQPLAGSVHLASTLPGTVQVLGSVQTVGTSQALGSVSIVGTFGGSVGIVGTPQVLGTVQTHGTSQILGTTQPLAGSVHLASRLPGTVDIGTVAGTVSVLGTVQILAGSVHLATNLAGGTIVSVGSAVHDAAADTRPHLIGAFGSSGTQAAVNDGDAVRLWADLNGRLQIRGTIDSMPAVTVSQGTIPGGTVVNQPLVTAAGTYTAARLTDGASFYTVTGGAVNVADQALFQAGVSAGAPMMGISTITAIGNGSIGLLAMGSDRVTLVRPYGGTLDGGTFQAFGTTQILGTVATTLAGTLHVGSVQRIAGGTLDSLPAIVITSGTVSLHTGGTIHIGSVQSIAGTVQGLGTYQPLAGSVHLATNLAGGTAVAVGSLAVGILAGAAMRPVLIGAVGSSGTQAAQGDGSITQLWTDLNGRLQVRGTIDSIPAIVITSGTVSLQTGGTIHIGSVQSIAGTVQALGTVQTHGTVSVGTIAGTVSILGTTQPLAGSVHLATGLPGGTVVSVGSAVHGAAADTRPHLMAAFGSSGTQAAVDDGDSVRLWADLNGRLQVRGTIDSIPNITITAGTVSLNTGGTMHIGSVQLIAGTVQGLGTYQPLAGSVHLATNLAGGTVVAVGSLAVGVLAGAAMRPLLLGAVGSSGTQAAQGDGSITQLWADLNGRLQVRGTIDSIPNITITAGTVSLNTGGTIHVGSVQSIAGTVHIGTVQRIQGGTINSFGGTLGGGTIIAMPGGPNGSYFGTAFTAAVTDGTVIAPLGQGTRWRIMDIIVSASAAGTIRFTEATSGTLVVGPLFFAANGGMAFPSVKGILARGTNLGLFATNSAGTMGVTVNYQIES